jgi:tetratricopeptide (TPR) repeat protein
MRVFEAVLHLAPETAAAWLRLGQCHAEIDDDKCAIACFERAHSGDPYNLDALLALGVSYINERDNEKALAVLQSWVEHHPLLQGVRASGDAYSDGSLADSVMQVRSKTTGAPACISYNRVASASRICS